MILAQPAERRRPTAGTQVSVEGEQSTTVIQPTEGDESAAMKQPVEGEQVAAMVQPVKEVQPETVTEGDQSSSAVEQPKVVKISSADNKLKEESADVMQSATGGEEPKPEDMQPSKEATQVMCY